MHTPDERDSRRAARPADEGGSDARKLSPALLCLALALGLAACSGANRAQTDDGKSGAGVTAKVTNTGANPAADARAGMPTAAGANTPKSILPPEIAASEIAGLDGERFTLADYKGKVVVLDLWATWCPPCRQEVPHLVALDNEFKERGVEVVGLTVEDAEEDAETVRDFAHSFGINYKLGFTNEEIQKLGAYGGGSIPQTLVIGRDGTVLLHYTGFNPSRTPAKVREAVERALAQAS